MKKAILILAAALFAAVTSHAQATAIKFVSSPAVEQENYCSTPIIIGGVDSSGQPAPIELTGGADIVFTWSGNILSFYTDAACTIPTSQNTGQARIQQGSIDSAPVYFIANSGTGNIQLTAQAHVNCCRYGAVFNPVSQQASIGGAPAAYGFVNSPLTVKANTCSPAMYAQLVDINGVPTTNDRQTQATFLSLSGSAFFYTDSQCNTHWNPVQIPGGKFYKTSTPLFFKALSTGTLTLSWTYSSGPYNFSPASQNETIN